jgi:exodeoxyribonuclease VII small subunit
VREKVVVEINNQGKLKSLESMSYEEAFSQLERIVTELESSEGSLENALALYERGKSLAQRCAALLEQAELKVKYLSGEEPADLDQIDEP